MDEYIAEWRAHQRIAMCCRYIDMISQHAIIFYFQRLNAGLLSITILQARYNTPAFVTKTARRIQSGVITVDNKAAIAPSGG